MEIKKLSVIVPAYKQEKYIKKDLLRIYKVLKETAYKFEIIVVVDGTSLDKTYKKAKEIKNPYIRVFGYKTNKGKGQAVRYGMTKARGDIITFIDSGGDINPQGITMLLEHMKWYGTDIIIGSKLHTASKVKNYPLQRKILTFGYYFLVKALFRLNVRDTQTGLKAYKRRVLDDVLPRLVIKRFAFDVEILAVAKRLGYTMADAPVRVTFEPANSSLIGLGILKSILIFVLDTVSVWYRMYILRFYDEGRLRKKVLDKELGMKINTGDMYGKKQVIIDFVNFVWSILKDTYLFIYSKLFKRNKKHL